ncbi:MAG: hypothetical protein CME62_02980 [Halobacteriovoraceae bacterium]|nr:hypothetical protein [Halobacteriovoraceae bacterium]
MSYQVLALKWRPRLFKDAVGQESIAQTLKNSIKNDKIAHAYLLTGTRGIGKTTFARIFAKAIKCLNKTEDGEPCLTCESCLAIDNGQSLDYIEIDGASNNSVDDIRDLIENVQYLPTHGNYKVYIIDEVHMLSVSAFNALLKTLEEPPKHVVFIFATTDPQKLLGTVLSRCIRFDFKNATVPDLVKHLNYIASEEGITFESDYVTQELAKQARGSFRDALSLFDQVLNLSSEKHITEKALNLSLGMADTNIVAKFVNAIIAKDKDSINQIYTNVVNDNIDFKKFAEQVLSTLGEVIFAVNNNLELNQLSVDLDVEQVSLVELMWIYETLYRDFDWSFNTFEAEQATQFVFIKVALREMLLNKSAESISVKKKVVKPTLEKKAEPQVDEEVNSEVVADAEESEAKDKVEVDEEPVQQNVVSAELEPEERSWKNFLKFLNESHRGLAVNLEHGNLINKEDFGSVDCVYEIGFSEDSKIFYDYLIELDNSYKLKEVICNYLELDISQIEVNLKLIENKQGEEAFLSNAQITEKNNEEETFQKREQILKNKFIKSAEELFSSEVQHVVLNKTEN